MLSKLFHLLCFSYFGYSLCWHFIYVNIPEEYVKPTVGGKLKNLTIWNMIFHCIFYAVSFFYDIISLYRKNEKLQYLKSFFFTSVVLPLGLYVFFTFWILMAIDRDKIFPIVYEKFYPNWLNHNMHTVILPCLIIECFICDHSQSPRKKGLQFSVAVMLSYIFWILFIYFYNGVWVYIFLRNLSWLQRFIFSLASVCFIILLHTIGTFLINVNVKFVKMKTK